MVVAVESGRDQGFRQMAAGLLTASHLMPLELLPSLVGRYAEPVGFGEVLIYLGDLQRRVLRLLTGRGADGGAGAPPGEGEMPVEGSVAGRAYQYGELVRAATEGAGARQWWVPLLDGTERLGVLRVTTAVDDRRACEDMEHLASLVAMLVVSKRESSDAYARLARTRPMNVAAEMQWQLMPPRSYAEGRVAISSAMEPAYTISGDAFDYAVAGSVVHLAIFDAMGHDTAAGLTANLAVAAARNARRQGASLAGTGEFVEKTLIEQYGHSRYVTGILAELDTATGVLSWVNRGHHPPLIIRGGRWTTPLQCRPTHPMGTGLGLRTTECRDQLEPGDRVVFYTDGITEARSGGDTEFGLERFTDFLIRHHADGLPVAETLRRLIRAVLDYHDDRLQDDATVLLCEWLGAEPNPTRQAADLAGLPGLPGLPESPPSAPQHDGPAQEPHA